MLRIPIMRGLADPSQRDARENVRQLSTNFARARARLQQEVVVGVLAHLTVLSNARNPLVDLAN